MTVEDLRAMYDYGYWANHQLSTVLAQITSEEFTQTLAGGHASIRNTLVHAMSAEWGWMDRCGGPRRGAALVPADYPSVATLMERWCEVEQSMREFLASLEEADLERVVEFSLGGGPLQHMRLGELMRHGAIHGVHHRGQVALLLRSLGHTPGNFDMLEYYRRQG
jgi:uncharacterized damage-inducible protein DinB